MFQITARSTVNNHIGETYADCEYREVYSEKENNRVNFSTCVSYNFGGTRSSEKEKLVKLYSMGV